MNNLPNKNRIVATGGVLLVFGVLTALSPSESDLIILSPNFIRRTEIGYLHDEAFLKNVKCNNQIIDIIYRTKNPNHIAELTEDFRGMEVKVEITKSTEFNPDPDPLIIIETLDQSGNIQERICEDNEHNKQEVLYFSYENVEKVPKGLYQVWVGDKIKNEGKTPYRIIVVENP